MNEPSFEHRKGLAFRREHDYGDGEKNVQWVFRFENGYGLSVIRGFGAIATKDAPYEAAVLVFEDGACEITYSTPVAHDIIPRLTEAGVLEKLDAVEALGHR